MHSYLGNMGSFAIETSAFCGSRNDVRQNLLYSKSPTLEVVMYGLPNGGWEHNVKRRHLSNIKCLL